MPKFRKKPVVIDAMLVEDIIKMMNDENRFDDLPKWIIENFLSTNILNIQDDNITIRTLEGDKRADKTDYLIRDVQGELYPCKPDIFKQTYEPVESEKIDFSNKK